MTNEPAMTGEAFDQGRERLLAAMRADNVSTKGNHLGTGSGNAPRASAAEVLDDAAGLAAKVKDQPVGPGQYRYVSRRSEGITFHDDGDVVSRSGVSQDTWIPADPRDTWLERRAETGKSSWVPGHEGDGPAPDEPAGLVGEWSAPCGAFGYFADDSKPSCDKGDWANPTPEFLAGLPKDPAKLYQRLLADSGSEAGVVIEVGNTLSTGRIPAEYRALLYRAVAHAPNLRVTEDVATLDGRTGTALGVDFDGLVRDFIIDPTNGEFIGYREVLSEEDHDVAAGTVRESSSTTTAVVDEAGEGPTR